jgi:hypothetical protein
MPRGGRRVGDLLRAGVLTLCLVGCAAPAYAQDSIGFGFDVASVRKAREIGLPVKYGTIWAGPWNQRWGWLGIQNQLELAKASGVQPVIHWWYWGDDITPGCVENGCWDARQQVQKDKATWYRLSNELADLVVRVLGPKSGAMVVVEAEFNKGGIENYEPFDGYLAEHAQIFHNRQLRVVTEFGNWGQSLWPRFDRAVAASDMLGAMVLQSSIHEASHYQSGADMLLNAARYYQATFGKPVFVTDFAFSSYPEPAYETLQDLVVAEIFSRMGEFRAAGVRGMAWRMLADDPAFDTSNYHGMAERFWGLIRADGSPKAAFTTFSRGLLAEGSSTKLPTAPPRLTVSAGDGMATLSWQNVPGATSYTVQYSTTSGGPYQVISQGSSSTSHVHQELVNGVTYYYLVTARNGEGEGAASPEASVTPKLQAFRQYKLP